MTRVVMLTNVVAPDKLGGLERYVRELSEALAGQGVSVSIVAKTNGSTRPGVEVIDDRLTIVRYLPPSKRNPFFGVVYPLVVAAAVRRALRVTGADSSAVRRGEVLLHGHFPVPMIPVLLSRLPFVYTMHAPVFKELLGERQGTYSLPRPLQRIAVAGLAALERKIVQRAARRVTLSEFVAQEVRDLAGADVDVHRIPGGLDVERFSPGASKQHEGEPVMFCARRLVERTGVELLVEAMPSILHRLPQARLSIAGEGPRRAAIESLVDRHGLHDSVTLLGRISDDELLSWYRSSDLCITPTLYLEGFGLSTAEAMACGTPAVVTPAGANAELVHPVDPVLLAAATTPAALADAVVDSWRAAQDPALGERARSSIAPRMGWREVAARHGEIYSALEAELARSAASSR